MTFNAQIVSGDDVDLVITILNKDDTAVDLTNATAITFKVRATPQGKDFVALDLTSGVAVTTAVDGVITVSLTPAVNDFGLLPPGEYRMEVQVTDSVTGISTVKGFNEQFGCLTVVIDLDN